MDIAKYDNLCIHKSNAFKHKYQLLLKKYTSLKKKQHNNHQYKKIIKQYKDYILTIKKQQTEQYNALQELSDYIDNIHDTTKLSEQLLNESKHDQHEILNKMKIIKKKIDNISKIVHE